MTDGRDMRPECLYCGYRHQRHFCTNRQQSLPDSPERAALEEEVGWCREVSFDDLSDEEVLAIVRSVRESLDTTRRASVPVRAFFRKERRRGHTNRIGWRWVVYTSEDKLGQVSVREEQVFLRQLAARRACCRYAGRRWAEVVTGKRIDAYDTLADKIDQVVADVLSRQQEAPPTG